MHHNYDISTKDGRRNLTLAAIAVTFTLLLLVFAILLCMNVASAIKDRNADAGNEHPDDQSGETPDTPTDPSVSDLTTVTLPTSAVHQGTLILVNSAHVYKFPANEDHLTNIYHNQIQSKTYGEYFLVAKGGLMLELGTYSAMTKMLTAFAEQSGLPYVQISDAYRSYEQQAALKSATKPGYSDHHTGLCVALNICKGGKTYELSSNEAYNWLYDNCYKYGFVERYPADKEEQTGVSNYTECFRYVGYVHAYAMKTQDKCLEEYVADLRGYSVNAPLQITTDDASNYEIYYVPAVGTETAVPVPSESTYTISGDNEGGFIVTVKLS